MVANIYAIIWLRKFYVEILSGFNPHSQRGHDSSMNLFCRSINILRNAWRRNGPEIAFCIRDSR